MLFTEGWRTTARRTLISLGCSGLLGCAAATPIRGPDAEPTEAAKRGHAECTEAFANFRNVTSTWSDWFGGDAMETAPEEKDFLRLCGTLSESARVCFAAEYARDHREDCVVAFRALPRETRHALDELLVTRESTN